MSRFAVYASALLLTVHLTTAYAAAVPAVPIVDLCPGAAGSDPGSLTHLQDGRVLFTASSDGVTRGYYIINATGTSITPVSMPPGYSAPPASVESVSVDAGTVLFVTAWSLETGYELLAITGTTATVLPEIIPGPEGAFDDWLGYVVGMGNDGRGLVVHNTTLYLTTTTTLTPVEEHTYRLLGIVGHHGYYTSYDDHDLRVLDLTQPLTADNPVVADLPDAGTLGASRIIAPNGLYMISRETFGPSRLIYAPVPTPGVYAIVLMTTTAHPNKLLFQLDEGGGSFTVFEAPTAGNPGDICTLRQYQTVDGSLLSTTTFTLVNDGEADRPMRTASGVMAVAVNRATTSDIYLGSGATLPLVATIARDSGTTLTTVNDIILGITTNFPTLSQQLYRIDAAGATLLAIVGPGSLLSAWNGVWSLRPASSWSWDGTTERTFTGATFDPNVICLLGPGMGDHIVVIGDAAGTGREVYRLSTYAAATDATPPTVVIVAPAGPTNSASLSFTATFSEPVSGVAAGDFTATHGTVTAISGSGTSYTITVTPDNIAGTVSLAITAGSAADAAGNALSATGSTLSAGVSVDRVAPSFTITMPAGPITTVPVPVTLTASESISGFTQDDLVITGATLGGWHVSGLTATASLTPTGSGTITAAIVGGAVSDAVGNPNGEASDTVVFTLLAPAITSSLTASGTVGTAFSYTIAGQYLVTGFNATSLPAGLTVNTSTGAITGTPTDAGTTSATIQATNATGMTTATLVITITASGGGSSAPSGGGGGGGCGAGSLLGLLIACWCILRPR